MGLLAIPCSVCGKTFMWFTGLSNNQICLECITIANIKKIREREKNDNVSEETDI